MVLFRNSLTGSRWDVTSVGPYLLDVFLHNVVHTVAHQSAEIIHKCEISFCWSYTVDEIVKRMSSGHARREGGGSREWNYADHTRPHACIYTEEAIRAYTLLHRPQMKIMA
jgi:hypothetical protein